MRRRRWRKFLIFFCGFLAVSLAAVIVICLHREQVREVEIENIVFTESARKLSNPNRGFYQLYLFSITDSEQDYPQMVSALSQQDTDTKLALVQICIQAYRRGAITSEGLANIEALFNALGALDKQLIVRFTYDSEGLNEQYEPESLDIILKHMDQLSDILRRHSRNIFTLQGLFIGNWGEMNGTRYSSERDLRRLAEKLASVTEPSTYLAVRSPAQWRGITQLRSAPREALSEHILAGRLGLFNDGMLGNQSDYGTYSTGVLADDRNALYPRLTRSEELAFQNQLCRAVPNGGEVINANRYNDLHRAIKDMEKMHITYLNSAYDQKVLEKWAESTITEEGCFQGMDGLTYIERHLGYRLSIVQAGLQYQIGQDTLTAEIVLKNEGFAPLYKETKSRIILYDEENSQTSVYPFHQDLSPLAGGPEKEETLTLSIDIPLRDFSEQAYTVYFYVADADTAEPILLANEADAEEYGYRIGRFSQKWSFG